MGLIHESARLDLEFTELSLPDGRSIPVTARLRHVDSARESVDKKGVIRGIRSTSTISNRFGQRIIFAALHRPVLLAPIYALHAGIFRFAEPEIEYGAGAELYLEVSGADAGNAFTPCALDEPALTEGSAAALQRLVDGIPQWSYSKRQPNPMDRVNLVYIGSREALSNAFKAAGWQGSAPNSFRSGFGAVRAIAENTSYEEAPMRDLLLDGVEPSASYQKSLNTFAKRHHLRVWEREMEYNGQTVWASAATQDLGLAFELKPFGFTHKIEKRVDLERDKVAHDLAFTGCVDQLLYVGRTAPLEQARRGVTTDGRVAVAILNSCANPTSLIEGPPPPKPNRVVRIIRRITLTARNHVIRDNIFYRGADLSVTGIRHVYRWRKNRAEEREAAARAGRNAATAAVPAAPPSAPTAETAFGPGPL
jgi:hypothetical protein